MLRKPAADGRAEQGRDTLDETKDTAPFRPLDRREEIGHDGGYQCHADAGAQARGRLLTEHEVRQVVDQFAAGALKPRLAAAYGVSLSTIKRTLRRARS